MLRNSAKAGWRRRMSFSWVTKGASEPGASQSRDLISYFSEYRYSSLFSDAGVF